MVQIKKITYEKNNDFYFNSIDIIILSVYLLITLLENLKIDINQISYGFSENVKGRLETKFCLMQKVF